MDFWFLGIIIFGLSILIVIFEAFFAMTQAMKRRNRRKISKTRIADLIAQRADPNKAEKGSEYNPHESYYWNLVHTYARERVIAESGSLGAFVDGDLYYATPAQIYHSRVSARKLRRIVLEDYGVDLETLALSKKLIKKKPINALKQG